MTSALAASPAVEGAFVFGVSTVTRTLAGGPPGSPRAGVGGVGIGRFAWMSPEGIALNARTSAADMLGLVLPFSMPFADWRAVYFDDATRTWRIREGLAISMLTQGNVWARFPFGAYGKQPVYANLLDGAPISGYSVVGELTPWSVVTPTQANQLAIISTWSN